MFKDKVDERIMLMKLDISTLLNMVETNGLKLDKIQSTLN